MPPDLVPCLTLISSNSPSRIYLYGSKGIRAIEVLLYIQSVFFHPNNHEPSPYDLKSVLFNL